MCGNACACAHILRTSGGSILPSQRIVMSVFGGAGVGGWVGGGYICMCH